MKKVLVLVGPTAVGKTAFSIELAQRFHGEIISGDSIQVYRGLDIGSGKITGKTGRTALQYRHAGSERKNKRRGFPAGGARSD